MNYETDIRGDWAVCFGRCFCCAKTFGFNPHKVPSFRHEGERQPICETCMGLINTKREEAGLPPHHIPDDAYQPIPASEL